MDEPDRTSCEEYGHLFRRCHCEMDCKFLICEDCGDEYEED